MQMVNALNGIIFNSDTPQGCKYAIKEANKQFQTEQHPVAMRHLNEDLTFLEVRAVRMKKSSEGTADATDTTDVAGATDATNAAIAKPRKKKPCSCLVFLVSELWNNQDVIMQDTGIYVADLVGGLVTTREAPKNYKGLFKVVGCFFRVSSLRRRHARQRAVGRAGRRAQWEIWYFDHA